MTREQKAFKRMFGKKSLPQKPRTAHYPTRTMLCATPKGQAELVWTRKYGVWFLTAVSKGFAHYFLHGPITGKGFQLWANRTQHETSWLSPSTTAKNLELFAD